MYFGYLQGRSEKDPSTSWYEGELWFFDFYVIPLARKLKECGVFGVSSEEYLDYAVRNRTEWARKGKEVAKTMLEGAMKEAHKKGLKRMDSVDEDDEELSDSEGSVSKDAKPDVVAEPATDFAAAAATAGEAVEAASTKPAWIVQAPPGKLGIIIDTTVEGPVVHRLSVGSVMKLKLAPGDLITSIDGVKTLGLSADAISALMSSRAEHERSLTIQRSQS
jgi:C-terminal processing protease CtpA/Prc